MDQYIGCSVSLECGGPLGNYQGIVSRIDVEQQTVTIHKPFCNGVPYNLGSVTFCVKDIEKLEILDAAKQSQHVARSVVPLIPNKTKVVGDRLKGLTTSDRASPQKGFQSPRKSGKDGLKGRQQRVKNEACFSGSVNLPQEEFDFEKNLALFNKQAVFEELDARQPDVVRLGDATGGGTSSHRSTPAKYRHDQNVITPVSSAVATRITVPDPPEAEYVTDAGIVVPSISTSCRATLLETARRHGLSTERQLEMLGRGCAEMALQLIGSHTRLLPENSHQAPRVICLCGPHIQGAAGLSAARQLSGHGVHVCVYLPELALSCRTLSTELQLYRLTGGTLVHHVHALPEPVDLIVSALDDHELFGQLCLQPWHRAAVGWANSCRSPALALDPPPVLGGVPLSVKHTLAAGMPLAYGGNAAVYLCNVNIPAGVFTQHGIGYVSPFGARLVIPLHAR